jgi:hypothetical protein
MSQSPTAQASVFEHDGQCEHLDQRLDLHVLELTDEQLPPMASDELTSEFDNLRP